MKPLEYVFRVVDLVKMDDGDTYWLRLDVGFRATQLVQIRLNGFDCPETHATIADYTAAKWDGTNKVQLATQERQMGEQAEAVAASYLQTALAQNDLWVKSYMTQSFARWMGDVFTSNDSLGDVLHAQGLASDWPTRWRDAYLTAA